MRIESVKSLFIIVAILVSGMVGCGQNSEESFEVRNGFLVNFAKLSEETNEIAGDSLVTLFGNAIDKYEETYGSCGKSVSIEVMEYSFYSEDLKTNVSGLSYNYGDSCEIQVGIHPTSGCETAMILMHELYHCCKNVSEHGDWAYDIFDLRDAMEADKDC